MLAATLSTLRIGMMHSTLTAVVPKDLRSDISHLLNVQVEPAMQAAAAQRMLS
jgi:hypothetical protein